MAAGRGCAHRGRAAGIACGVTLITNGELGGTAVIGFAVAAIMVGAALTVPD
jgi:hypothetical protein